MKVKSNYNNISRIYFFGRCYCRGGGTTFFFNLIDYLLEYTDIKIGVIDFPDGIMTRTAKKFYSNEDIDYINNNEIFWNLEDNSCIVTPTDRIGLIKKVRAQNVRILGYFWNNDTAWNILFENSVMKKLGNLLKKTNSVSFMDYGNYIYACKSFNQNFNKNYIPLFYYPDVKTLLKHIVKPNEINLVWLGRISGPKTSEIVNIIENFDKYQTNKKKIFHIIGNGLDEAIIKSLAERYKNNIDFRFTGLLVGQELADYLVKNADVGIAMGMSALNFAAFKIPLICAHNSRGGILRTNEFKWLFDMYEYNLGSPTEKPFNRYDTKRFENIYKFDEMLDSVSDIKQQKQLADKCYKYFLATHANFKFIGESFLSAINQTRLTYEQLKKCFRFIPYGGPGGGGYTYLYNLWVTDC